MLTVCYFFLFKQKTAYEMRISDWSSDVCSSDLIGDDLRQVITNLRTVNEKLVADYNLLVEKHNGLVESYNTLREEALAKKESRTRQNSQIDKLIQAMFAGYRLLGFKGLAKAYIADLALRYSDLARRHDEPVPPDKSDEHTSELQS